FCNPLIHSGLPWKTKLLEQRIGRIHPSDQETAVRIYHFSIRDTNEAHVVTRLYEKINLFEQVIGQLHDILAELNISDMESEIQNIFTESTSAGEAEIKLNNLSSVIKHTHETINVEEQSYGNN